MSAFGTTPGKIMFSRRMLGTTSDQLFPRYYPPKPNSSWSPNFKKFTERKASGVMSLIYDIIFESSSDRTVLFYKNMIF